MSASDRDEITRFFQAAGGGDPFMDFDFLVGEIKRVNAVVTTVAKAP